MIVRVTMKDPDVLIDAIEDAVNKELADSGLDEAEIEAVRDIRVEKAMEVSSTWFEWGEYLTVEIDTTAKTIKVVERED